MAVTFNVQFSKFCFAEGLGYTVTENNGIKQFDHK